MKCVHRERGFSLLELLVVIAIVSMLAAALLPALFGVHGYAAIETDKLNLRAQFIQHKIMRDRGIAYRDGGHDMVLGPWMRGVTPRTEANRNRHFSPHVQKTDPDLQALRRKHLREIWNSPADTTSADTSYAGRAREHLATMWRPNEPMMANDNEHGNTFIDGTINVLMSDGSVKELRRDEHLAEHWRPEHDEAGFPVGKGSPHPLLRKLRK